MSEYSSHSFSSADSFKSARDGPLSRLSQHAGSSHTALPHVGGAGPPTAPPRGQNGNNFVQLRAADDGDNDWGSFELSDEDEGPIPPFAAGRASSADPPVSIAGGGGDVRLGSYVEPHSQAALAADSMPHVLTGIYADPAAKKDDWADDFELEARDAAHTDEILHETAGSTLPPPDSPVINSEVFSRLNIPHLDIGAPGAPLPPTSHAPHVPDSAPEETPRAEFALNSRLAALASHRLPVLGYEAEEVHQGCAHLKELFGRHSISIQQHVDDVMGELRNLDSLDQRALSIYLFSADADVARLAEAHQDAAADILEWKLELARLTDDELSAAKAMLGLAQCASRAGDVDASQEWLDKVTAIADSFEPSSASISLRIESDYEAALNQRRKGQLEAANLTLSKTISKCKTLTEQPSLPEEDISPEQRAIWWSLRSKCLLAEVCKEQNQISIAIQLFAEYSLECIARMIGLIGGPTSGQGLVWYSLFSPSSLVHAIWSCTRCLFEIRAFSPASDMAAVVMHAAFLFGNKDVNDSAADLRAQARVVLRENKKHQAAMRASTGSPSSTLLEFSGQPWSNRNEDIQVRGSTPVEADFEGSVESEEDWDKMLAEEMNIKIERCSNGAGLVESGAATGEIGVSFPGAASHVDDSSCVLGTVHGRVNIAIKPQVDQFGAYQRSASADLMEGELRLYLNQIHGAAASLSVQQMYPKPTVPFEGPVLGVREHEAFLRNFVRGKDPRFLRSRGFGRSNSVWDPSDVDERHKRNPMKQFRSKSQFVDRLSSRWTTLVLDTAWSILRGGGPIEDKRANIRTLLTATIREATDLTRSVPIVDEVERMERLDMLSGLLEALRLSREILTTDGQESIWFSRACTLLGMMASQVKPAAKAAVELFQAESRAHCGVVAITPPSYIIQCADAGIITDTDALPSNSKLGLSDIAASLRHSVVDILHALFWRTKSGFDENSGSTSFEHLIHADVASTLFLTGSGISSVDGSRINVAKDEAILNLPSRSAGIEGTTGHIVDETRRVSGPELVQELNTMWASLPSSAGAVRAKVSFALALHSSAEPHEYGRTEQILFDGLQSLHSVSASSGDPISFFSVLPRVSPIAVVSSPLSEAMLQAYGSLTLRHSKYQYGIAALEAATDSRRVRDLKNQSSLATAMEIACAARSKGDWRRALVLLHDLRGVIHPKDGKRNDFIHLCLLVHQICMDVGCFGASIVPLRAFSALIYEERLRVLLLRYRRRLARKSRNRQKLHFAASPLPTVMSKTPYLRAPSASLAVLLESPLRASGAGLDGNFMRTPAPSEARDRPEQTPLGQSPGLFPSWVPGLKRTPSRRNSNTSTEEPRKSFEDQSEGSVSRDRHSKKLSRKKSKKTSAIAKKRPRAKPHSFEEEQKELLRIEAEQELVADAERFQVEFLLIKAAYAAGNYPDADSRCRGLLEMKMPHSLRYKVCEVRTCIALKRREISRCLELIELMEREYRNGFKDGSNAEYFDDDESVVKGGSPFFRNDDSSKTIASDGSRGSGKAFIPSATFLKLSALLHGGRLAEGLSTADEALNVCPETELWNRARLHYLRGKILFEISSISTAPFERGEGPSSIIQPDFSQRDLQNINLTLSAFETASSYYDAAGDEIGTLKSDLLWARTCIDTLFRRVVLPRESGGGVRLDHACQLGTRTISPHEVEDAVHTVLYMASTAHLPIVLIDALAALAEIKSIRGESAKSVSFWVTESWRLFYRLLTDSEDFTVVLTSVAPVSSLMRLRKLCGRLVRLVLCGPKASDVGSINHHLHMFEAYVTLQTDIDRRMSLATSSAQKTGFEDGEPEKAEMARAAPSKASEGGEKRYVKSETMSEASLNRHASIHDRLASVKKHYGREKHPESADSKSRNSTDSHRGDSSRPAGAFLHMLGNQGAALGRLGLSVIINRPRKHVISAVRETGAVLIPSNFFTNSRAQEKTNSHVLGKDAELIFPFEENLGLGAMQILDGPPRKPRAQSTPSPSPEAVNLSDSEVIPGDTVPFNRNIQDVVPEPIDIKGGTSSLPKQKTSFMDPDGKHWVAANERGKGQSGILDHVTTQLPDAEVPLVHEMSMEDFVNGLGEDTVSVGEAANHSRIRFERSAMPSELVDLVESVRAADNSGGRPIPPAVFGGCAPERVWAHLHRIKAETRRYVHGGLTIEELGDRNREALRSWLLCLPRAQKGWTVPESIAKRLVYVLFAHGVLGYYVVDRCGCVGGVGFGGKQVQEAFGPQVTPPSSTSSMRNGPRPVTDAERTYLANLVRTWKRGDAWYKDRDTELINGISGAVLRAPRTLLTSQSPSHKTKGRPIVLIADATVQVLPWELFFDHVVIRSLSLLGIIRGVQDDPPVPPQSPMTYNTPNSFSNRSLTRIVCFTTSRRESGDLLRTEEARRQDLAFKSLLRLNHLCAPALISKLKLGDFSDPTAVNAVAMPTGPLSTPLTQSRKPTKLLGVRLEGIIGKRNYPHVDFLKVPGLGSATTSDLKMALLERVNEKEGEKPDMNEYITVFLFTYADLIGGSQSVFGLTSAVPRGMLMFTPASNMKVLARHLEDDELTRELDRVSGSAYRKRPDICACARILVQYVSRFSRDKRIPIVVFLGEGLVDVFPRKRPSARNVSRVPKYAAESLFQRPPNSPFR